MKTMVAVGIALCLASAVVHGAATRDLQLVPRLLTTGDPGEARLVISQAGTWIMLSSETQAQTDNAFVSLVWARRSTDGKHWSEPSLVFSSVDYFSMLDRTAPGDYGLVTDQQSHWLAHWNTGIFCEFYVCRSDDDGVTWGPATKVLDQVPLNTYDYWESVVWSSGRLIATGVRETWIDDGAGSSDQICRCCTASSTDFGTTWTEPSPINTGDQACHTEFVEDLGTDGAGNAGLVLLCANYPDPIGPPICRLILKTSSDAGQTWTTRTTIPQIGDRDVRNARLAANPNGEWVLVWDDGFATYGNSNIWFSTSTDGAATWSEPARLDPHDSVGEEDAGQPQVGWSADLGWIASWRHYPNDFQGPRLVTRSSDGLNWLEPQELHGNSDRSEFQPYAWTQDANGRAMAYGILHVSATDRTPGTDDLAWGRPDFNADSSPITPPTCGMGLLSLLPGTLFLFCIRRGNPRDTRARAT